MLFRSISKGKIDRVQLLELTSFGVRSVRFTSERWDSFGQFAAEDCAAFYSTPWKKEDIRGLKDILVAADKDVPPDAAINDRFHKYGDRKSTRLNSSHGYISYAVFCLKKKRQP